MITRYYPVTLTLDAPLLITVLEGDPSSSQSMDFIPGAALRGAVARSLCSLGVDRSHPEQFHKLVLSDRVCYLNAYVVAQNRRCLPTPVSFRCEKYGSQRHDLAGYNDDEWPDTQLERLDCEYLTIAAPDLVPGDVRISGRVHHQRDRRIGRATKDVGAIFRYESLDACQQFQGMLAITDGDAASVDATAQSLRQYLDGCVLLGRSRRAGYGGAARITWDQPRDHEVMGDRVMTSDVSGGAIIRALLTSDYVGRSRDTGQLDPSAIEAELVNKLAQRVQVIRRFFEFRRIGGYNRKWGLQLPQALALRAGSLLLLQTTQEIRWDDLRTLAHSGLGERRAEGFGRVIFLEKPSRIVAIRPAVPIARPTEPAGGVPPTVIAMEKRLLWDALEQRILEAASDLAITPALRDIPSRSLLGRLRVPFRNPALQALDMLKEWLMGTSHGLKKLARDQLSDCILTVDQRRISLEDWLREMVVGTSALDHLLGFDRLAQRNHFVSAESARRLLQSQEWNAQIRAKLVDAVLADMARRKPREEVKHVD